MMRSPLSMLMHSNDDYLIICPLHPHWHETSERDVTHADDAYQDYMICKSMKCRHSGKEEKADASSEDIVPRLPHHSQSAAVADTRRAADSLSFPDPGKQTSILIASTLTPAFNYLNSPL